MTSEEINLDLTESKLILQGEPEEQDKWSSLIDKREDWLTLDRNDRKNIYKVRRDFYVGDHTKYTNIVGLLNKEKKGHASAVINYAGKTATKIVYSLTNNPPNLTFPIDPTYKPTDVDYETEKTRTQATEDFVDLVLSRNKFWKRGYRRGASNQVIVGDAFIKVYPCNVGTEDNPEWEIKVINHEKVENLLVGWRGDDSKEFDYVIAIEDKSVQSVEEEWGIKVPADVLDRLSKEDTSSKTGSNHVNGQWNNKATSVMTVPSNKNSIPTVKVVEYDDQNVYAIKVAGKLVQLVIKDNANYPKIKFWTQVENIPVPGSNWSLSDIDYLIDANVELNEASNEERDMIRIGTGQNYVAYNMDEFDPESFKPGSGTVIFVSSPDGSAKFEPLNQNVNNFPADSYLTRIKKHIHDLGVPEVTYGSGGSDSGRSKSFDYQSFVDLTIFKRDAWELALTEVSEKIQALGYFYFKHEFLTDPKTGEFKYRNPQYDWSDIVPITQGDKVVTVLNKVQMGLPFAEAWRELGYRDVEAIMAEMRNEAKDEDLMIFRSKMYQLAEGLVQAQAEATMATQAMGGGVNGEGMNPANAAAQGATLTSDQNTEGSQPMSVRGGTTSSSSMQGQIDQANQNLAAQQ